MQLVMVPLVMPMVRVLYVIARMMLRRMMPVMRVLQVMERVDEPLVLRW